MQLQIFTLCYAVRTGHQIKSISFKYIVHKVFAEFYNGKPKWPSGRTRSLLRSQQKWKFLCSSFCAAATMYSIPMVRSVKRLGVMLTTTMSQVSA